MKLKSRKQYGLCYSDAIWQVNAIHLPLFAIYLPEFVVPLIFMSGKYDMNDPFSLVKEYYEYVEVSIGK
jgi:hypothetical protein